MTEDNQHLPESKIDAICEQLWAALPNGQTPNIYAVLDGARNRRIEPLLNNGTLEHACLYSGRLSYAMQRAAPHIVKLEKGHPQTRKIIRMGWGNSWGIFAICQPTVSMVAVRNNCRRISRVESPEGKILIFRYYDPRVLRLFLPTCTPEELAALFGPTSDYICEAENTKGLQRYSTDPTTRQLQCVNADIEHTDRVNIDRGIV